MCARACEHMFSGGERASAAKRNMSVAATGETAGLYSSRGSQRSALQMLLDSPWPVLKDYILAK